ncbi:MAG: hypothetical protein ABSC92_05545 [Rhizomicrobium sp.]|jgi:hypothetical protein
MKTIAIAAAIAALSVGAAHAQGMQAAPADSHQICLQSTAIDHTKTVDKSTILFYMNDGKIWKNTLKAPCPSLNFHGFTYLTRADEICANAQSISVLVSNEVCVLGAFTPMPEQHASLMH